MPAYGGAPHAGSPPRRAEWPLGNHLAPLLPGQDTHTVYKTPFQPAPLPQNHGAPYRHLTLTSIARELSALCHDEDDSSKTHHMRATPVWVLQFLRRRLR